MFIIDEEFGTGRDVFSGFKIFPMVDGKNVRNSRVIQVIDHVHKLESIVGNKIILLIVEAIGFHQVAGIFRELIYIPDR